MTEFGVAHLETLSGFYAHLYGLTPHPDTTARPVVPEGAQSHLYWYTVDGFGNLSETTPGTNPGAMMAALNTWMGSLAPRSTFISDNPAFDFMWIADAYARAQMKNPFGYSARRIGDLYAGLEGDWKQTSKWKKLRTVIHDHNPLNDALGNAGALRKILTKHGQATFD